VEWVNENYPDQPDWLQNLKKGVQDLPESDPDPDSDNTTSEDVKKLEDKDESE